MTENKIKEATIEDAIYCAKAMACLEVCEECRFYGLCHTWCDDVYRIIVDALEEIQAYRAIGTVEEFKAYKLGDCMNDCEHYENCSNYIYSKGYNKAIDDFVKEIEAEYDNDDCPNVTDYLDYKISIRDLHKIAEQLKGVQE